MFILFLFFSAWKSSFPPVGFVGRIPPPPGSALSSTVFTSVDVLVEYEEEQTRMLSGRLGDGDSRSVLQSGVKCLVRVREGLVCLFGSVWICDGGEAWLPSPLHGKELFACDASCYKVCYALVNVSGWLPFASGQGWMSGQSTSRAYSLGGVL